MSKCLHRASSVSFQSTLPHGERSDIAIKAVDNMDFNPRPRMGSDLISFFGIAAFFRISIHAPRMGSDDSVDIPFDRILI